MDKCDKQGAIRLRALNQGNVVFFLDCVNLWKVVLHMGTWASHKTAKRSILNYASNIGSKFSK